MWWHRQQLAPGDRVVCRIEKRGTNPGPWAEQIRPETHGEGYRYQVRKFWIVESVESDGSVIVRTRRGKTRCLSPDHPFLRRAHWWERLKYEQRFPQPGEGGPVQPKHGPSSQP